MSDLGLYSVKAVLILDNEGKRLFSSYYDPPHQQARDSIASGNDLASQSLEEQRAFEKGLFSKTNKQNSDVIIYDSNVVVYKQVVDVIIYVVGSVEENEAMLYQVVVGLRDALEILLKHSVDKRTILENYDLVALAIDEAVDCGIILEVDPVIISSRVSRAPVNEAPSLNNIDLSEQGVKNMFSFARGKLAERLRQQFS
ncbi:coatomer subunit zeta [Trichomonascus vanleenenianus]|uniref:coatomer subunit zeta n=1 Tax=Trichomonascus vanleenenianus TaxID=2268995 RepID=UPI003ECB1467